MKIIYLLLIIYVGIVSAKYLPYEIIKSRSILWQAEKSESDESNASPESRDSNDDDDSSKSYNSDEVAALVRQQHIDKQRLEEEKERIRKFEEEIEDRKREEIERQRERKREEEENKLKQKKEKEERKREEELRKHEEKIKEQERKREEEEQKHELKREKEQHKRDEKEHRREQELEENNRKREEKEEKEKRKQLEKIAKDTLKLEEKLRKLKEKSEEDINSASNSVESKEIDLDDIWKQYVYTQTGISDNSSKLEKKSAVYSYLQEQYGLESNSTKSERRQALIKLIQDKIKSNDGVNDSFSKYLQNHVSAAEVEELKQKLEKKIQKLDNQSIILNNVRLVWAAEERNALEEKKSLLQSIVQYITNLLPNWVTGGNSNTSTNSSTSSANGSGLNNTNLNDLSSGNNDLKPSLPENTNKVPSVDVSNSNSGSTGSIGGSEPSNPTNTDALESSLAVPEAGSNDVPTSNTAVSDSVDNSSNKDVVLESNIGSEVVPSISGLQPEIGASSSALTPGLSTALDSGSVSTVPSSSSLGPDVPNPEVSAGSSVTSLDGTHNENTISGSSPTLNDVSAVGDISSGLNTGLNEASAGGDVLPGSVITSIDTSIPSESSTVIGSLLPESPNTQTNIAENSGPSSAVGFEGIVSPGSSAPVLTSIGSDSSSTSMGQENSSDGSTPSNQQGGSIVGNASSEGVPTPISVPSVSITSDSATMGTNELVSNGASSGSTDTTLLESNNSGLDINSGSNVVSTDITTSAPGTLPSNLSGVDFTPTETSEILPVTSEPSSLVDGQKLSTDGLTNIDQIKSDVTTSYDGSLSTNVDVSVTKTLIDPASELETPVSTSDIKSDSNLSNLSPDSGIPPQELNTNNSNPTGVVKTGPVELSPMPVQETNTGVFEGIPDTTQSNIEMTFAMSTNIAEIGFTVSALDTRALGDSANNTNNISSVNNTAVWADVVTTQASVDATNPDVRETSGIETTNGELPTETNVGGIITQSVNDATTPVGITNSDLINKESVNIPVEVGASVIEITPQ